MKPSELFEQLIRGEDLSNSQMQSFITSCMNGVLTDVQIGAFLALMRMKGETVTELSAAAVAMKSFAHTLNLGVDLIDIVGTGGDGKNTFNVSTVSSFVAAAAGARIAKHGNHSVSSRSGSADLLIQAGGALSLTDSALQQCMRECGIAFLFAPRFHRAMKQVSPARQQLKIKTLFNLLGPLLNPAQVKKQMVGVFHPSLLKPIAEVLAYLGSSHCLVVHSRDGLDEISVSALTDVVEYKNGSFKQWSIDPQQFGCYHNNLNSILVNSPDESLTIAHMVFDGKEGPARDIVLLNSATALYCAGIASDLREGIEKSAHAIDSGAAYQRFQQLIQFTSHEQHTNQNYRT